MDIYAIKPIWWNRTIIINHWWVKGGRGNPQIPPLVDVLWGFCWDPLKPASWNRTMTSHQNRQLTTQGFYSRLGRNQVKEPILFNSSAEAFSCFRSKAEGFFIILLFFSKREDFLCPLPIFLIFLCFGFHIITFFFFFFFSYTNSHHASFKLTITIRSPKPTPHTIFSRLPFNHSPLMSHFLFVTSRKLFIVS